MVRQQLYCAEQIVVPENLPKVLKTYAKDAIRTQPYDLLRWSLAYFKCLSLGIPPPVKLRLEPPVNFDSLTKGLVRTLLCQVGKGFFIKREVLESKWTELCLPENELLRFLSLTRMLDLPNVQWLKLVSVMIGSLTKNFRETVMAICEVFTDEPDGGPNPIPYWMFKECFEFLAEMDCSVQMDFVNGRRLLPNGELEELPRDIVIIPHISSSFLKDLIFSEWEKRREQIDIVFSLSTESFMSSFSSDTGASFNVNKADKIKEIENAADFDTVIVLLNETPDETSYLGNYQGPGKVSNEQKEHALKREREVHNMRERLADLCEADAREYMLQERHEIMKALGPPWTWMHQFASHNNAEIKSFNFVERESIDSDESSSSGDEESFDFEKERFVVDLQAGDVAAKNAEPCDTTSLDKLNIVEVVESEICEDEESEEGPIAGFTELFCKLTKAVSAGIVKLDNMSSISNFFEAEQKEAGTDMTDPVNIKQYKIFTNFFKNRKSLKQAHDDMDTLFSCFKSQYTQGLLDVEERENENIDIAIHDVQTSDHLMKQQIVLNVEDVEKERNALMKEFNCTVPVIPGIGPRISAETIDNFLKYLQSRASEENGLVFPRHMREADCPNMVDPD